MNAVDFEYDGQYLSDYGFIICDFNDSSGVDTISAGSTLTFNKVSHFNGRSFSLASTVYEECITSTFDICKDPDKFEKEEMEITSDEFRDLMRWLNRREFLKFQVHDDDIDYESCYFNASFNIEKIKIAEKVYGLRLTMETDKPFAYTDEQVIKWTVSDTTAEKQIYDMSDEIGCIYPLITVKCNESGNLTISNETFDTETTIKNCTQNETITIDGNTQIITSSNNAHAVYEDFNYEFFKIGNTFDNRINTITASLQCVITIRYTPIIKDIP